MHSPEQIKSMAKDQWIPLFFASSLLWEYLCCLHARILCNKKNLLPVSGKLNMRVEFNKTFFFHFDRNAVMLELDIGQLRWNQIMFRCFINALYRNGFFLTDFLYNLIHCLSLGQLKFNSVRGDDPVSRPLVRARYLADQDFLTMAIRRE